MSWQTLIPVPARSALPADPSQSRRASWLEFFFDLIFVAVAQVGVPLSEDYSVHGLVRYGLMFLPIMWLKPSSSM
jgi:low temperature requirement protein LtrA